jgi:hypothetical protein
VTDSGSDIVRAPDKPGVTNLIDILAVARGVTPQTSLPESPRRGGVVVRRKPRYQLMPCTSRARSTLSCPTHSSV